MPDEPAPAALPDTMVPDAHDRRTQRLIAFGVVGVVVGSILFHGVREAAGPWVPSGDDAYFTLRSLDVGTSHHPLLGAWSSGSADVDRQVNNLGPMQLDLLAPFTKIAWAGGTALAVALVHGAAIGAIGWLAHRLGGTRLTVAAMVGVALMAWVMGSEELVTPRQHQFLLVTYLCVLIAAWASAAGDRWGPLVFVVAGSLAAQTHLSYPILVAAASSAVVLGQLSAYRRADDGDRRAFRTAWLWAGGVGAVLWLQTLVDQFFGWGNLGDVFAASDGASSPGLGTGTRIVADVLVAPTGYLRPGFATYEPESSVAGDLQVVVLLLGWLVLASGAVVAIRRRRRVAGAGLAVAAIAVAAAVVDATRLPVTQFGLAAANYRWLWPTSAFLVIGLVASALRLADSATRSSSRSLVPIGATGAIVAALVAANVPRSYQVDRPEVYRDGQAAVAVVAEQLLDELPRRDPAGPVVIDQEEMYFGHPFAYPLGIVVAELGLAYRFEGPQQARRFGESRVADGSEPSRLVLYHGDAAAERFGLPDTVAYAPGEIPVAVVLETR